MFDIGVPDAWSLLTLGARWLLSRAVVSAQQGVQQPLGHWIDACGIPAPKVVTTRSVTRHRQRSPESLAEMLPGHHFPRLS